MTEFLVKAFGEGKDLNALQMSCRGAVVFMLTLVLIRIAGSRSFGLKKALDNIIVILLGSVLSRAVAGASPFIPTITASLVIVLLHRICAWLSIHYRWFSRLINGEKIIVYKGGAFVEKNMKKCLVSKEDIEEQVRLKALVDTMEKIKEAHMERNGEISSVKKEN